MAIGLGLGSPGRCDGYSVMQEIIWLGDNEFLEIQVMGDYTLLLRHVNRTLKEGILVCHLVIAILYCSQCLALIRKVWVAYILPNILCVLSS